MCMVVVSIAQQSLISQHHMSVHILFTQFPGFILTMTSVPFPPGSQGSSCEVESILMGTDS